MVRWSLIDGNWWLVHDDSLWWVMGRYLMVPSCTFSRLWWKRGHGWWIVGTDGQEWSRRLLLMDGVIVVNKISNHSQPLATMAHGGYFQMLGESLLTRIVNRGMERGYPCRYAVANELQIPICSAVATGLVDCPFRICQVGLGRAGLSTNSRNTQSNCVQWWSA